MADLTAAALLYPLFMPPEYLYPLIEADTPRLEALLRQMRAKSAIQWAGRIYAGHRNPARRAAA